MILRYNEKNVCGVDMILNMNHLRTFYTVAKTGSVSKAAQELMVTPPATTMQVKQFEKTVGSVLLFREGHTMKLTDVGKVIFEKAERVFGEITEMENLIEDIAVGKVGELRIGALQAHAKYVMPGLISAFEDTYPGIRVILDTGSTAQLVKSILDHTNELSLVGRIIDTMQIKTKILGKEDLVLATAPSSVYFSRQEISIAEIAKVPLILSREGTVLREVILSYLRKFQVTPSPVTTESSNLDFIKEFVRQDKGVCFFERYTVREELKNNTLREVHILEGIPNVDIGIAFLNSRNLSNAARAFLRLLDKSSELLPFSHV